MALFGKIHAMMEEEKKKSDPVDGRRFNRRSRARTDREAREIKKSIMKASRKKASRKSLYRGVFSQEEIDAGIEEKKEYRRLLSESKALKEAAVKESCNVKDIIESNETLESKINQDSSSDESEI